MSLYSTGPFLEYGCCLSKSLVLRLQGEILEHKEEVGGGGLKLLPFGRFHVVLQKVIVFLASQSPEVGIVDSLFLVRLFSFHVKGDSHTLLNVKDILVLTTCGRSFSHP